MTMTKKDFVIVAERLKSLKRHQETKDWRFGIAFIMEAFYSINPKFNAKIFMKAVDADENDQKQIMVMYRLLGGA